MAAEGNGGNGMYEYGDLPPHPLVCGLAVGVDENRSLAEAIQAAAYSLDLGNSGGGPQTGASGPPAGASAPPTGGGAPPTGGGAPPTGGGAPQPAAVPPNRRRCPPNRRRCPQPAAVPPQPAAVPPQPAAVPPNRRRCPPNRRRCPSNRRRWAAHGPLGGPKVIPRPSTSAGRCVRRLPWSTTDGPIPTSHKQRQVAAAIPGREGDELADGARECNRPFQSDSRQQGGLSAAGLHLGQGGRARAAGNRRGVGAGSVPGRDVHVCR